MCLTSEENLYLVHLASYFIPPPHPTQPDFLYIYPAVVLQRNSFLELATLPGTIEEILLITFNFELSERPSNPKITVGKKPF